MKICIKNCRLPALLAAFGSMLIGHLAAQTFTTLHTFPAAFGPFGGPYINSDGANPEVALILGNTLYGTASWGGTWGYGTVFALHTDGTDFTVLYNFSDSDGALGGGLILSGNTLYGTRTYGGTSGSGTVFAVNTDGTGFAVLYNFTGGDDGASPGVGLVLSSNTLCGTTGSGGNLGAGTVFAVNTDGTGFSVLHSFTALDPNTEANSDGSSPYGGLTSSSNTLYGTASHGGSSGHGTVFKLDADGTGFKVLHSFSPGIHNNDGIYPYAGLSLSSNTLYGTALYGGTSGYGTVFKVNTDGTGFTTLHNFTGGSDGGDPNVPPILSGSTLYGTAYDIHTGATNPVFSVRTDGTGFVTLYALTNGGARAALISGNTLYGTTAAFGHSSGEEGTVFSISLGATSRPELTITTAGGNVILTWPTNATGFTLQSTTNLVSPAWATNLPAPVVANGQFTVSNPITGTRQFFRLSE